MMNEVGRRKWVWLDLPPRMKARRLSSGKVLYYYQAGGKQIPLVSLPRRQVGNDSVPSRSRTGHSGREQRHKACSTFLLCESY